MRSAWILSVWGLSPELQVLHYYYIGLDWYLREVGLFQRFIGCIDLAFPSYCTRASRLAAGGTGSFRRHFPKDKFNACASLICWVNVRQGPWKGLLSLICPKLNGFHAELFMTALLSTYKTKSISLFLDPGTTGWVQHESAEIAWDSLRVPFWLFWSMNAAIT